MQRFPVQGVSPSGHAKNVPARHQEGLHGLQHAGGEGNIAGLPGFRRAQPVGGIPRMRDVDKSVVHVSITDGEDFTLPHASGGREEREEIDSAV